jgi:hypothetical protein
MITHLPLGLVGLLNAVYWGQEDCDEETQAFENTWNSVKSWHTFYGSYSVNEKEQRDLENFCLLWDEVHSLLAGPLEFEKLATPVFETIRIMEQLNEDRRFPHYSPVPAINEMLLAGAAFCLDRGSEQGVRDRLPLVEECAANLHGLYYEQEDRLPEEIRQSLSEGFELIRQGLAALHAGLPAKEAAQAGLADIKDGGSLVEFLLEWDQNEKLRLQKLYSRFNIPLIGSDLEIGLESVKSVERRKWRRGAKSTESELFPKLQAFWETVRDHLFLLPDERLELLENVDQSLLALRDAVAALKEKEDEDSELIEALTEALEWTSESFTALEESTLKPDSLGHGPERHIFDSARGILAGTVPDAALVELLKTSSLPADVLAEFQAFIQEGTEESLFTAVWSLHDSMEEREALEPLTQSWTCHLCGHFNEQGELSCQECRVVRK